MYRERRSLKKNKFGGTVKLLFPITWFPLQHNGAKGVTKDPCLLPCMSCDRGLAEACPVPGCHRTLCQCHHSLAERGPLQPAAPGMGGKAQGNLGYTSRRTFTITGLFLLSPCKSWRVLFF